jgi:hypothetical protein
MKVKMLFLLAAVIFMAAFSAAIMAVDPPEENGPGATTEAFYTWYLEYTIPDENGHIVNPLVDRAYRGSPYLTEALIERIDAQLAEDHIVADPFLCAQDVPESFEAQMVEWHPSVAMMSCTAEQSCQAIEVMPRRAVVMLRQFFAGNPRSYNITVELIAEDEDWRLDNIICGDFITPVGVTGAFYDWYLDYTTPDEAGHFNNPLVDKAYREAPYLSVGLIEEMDTLLSEPIMFDPFLCAQDIPEWYRVEEIDTGADTAQVMVLTYFSGNPVPSRLLVELTLSDEGWQLREIICRVSPEAVTVGFYNMYMAYVDYDQLHNIGRSPLADWSHDWSLFLDDTLYNELVARLSEPERVADPVLCAQDMPERIQVEVQDTGEEQVTLLVRGDYPYGPDTYTGYDLAVAELRLQDRQWKLTGLHCAR